MPGVVERVLGAVLLLVTLTDVFLTVLYARAGISIVARPVALGVWTVFKVAARFAGRRMGLVLSFCGPAVVVALILTWTAMLTLGAALIIHPALGGAVRADSGSTPTDFLSALYAGGCSISVVGASNLSPHSPAYRMFFLVTSLIGMSVVSLTVTYLMQLYSTLQRRNALALDVHTMTLETGDGARLLAALGAEGHFEAGYTNLSALAAQVGAIKEAHNFYPVLFYFHFPQDFYSVSRVTFTLLDMVTLLRTALDDGEAGWLKRSAGVEHLERAAMTLAQTLQRVYLAGERHDDGSDSDLRAIWRERYMGAVRILREAGVPIRRDLASGALQYVQRRARWDDLILRLGEAMLLGPDQVDPATAGLQPPPLSGAPRAAGASPEGR